MRSRIARFVAAWLSAAALTTVFAVFLQTQNLISRLNGIDAGIGVGTRMGTALHDILHLGPLYFVFIAIALGIAFLVGAGVYRVAGFGRTVIFAVAGAAAILVMLMAMKEAFFGVHLIAGARDTVGIAFQILAGAVGGLVFAALRRRSAL